MYTAGNCISDYYGISASMRLYIKLIMYPAVHFCFLLACLSGCDSGPGNPSSLINNENTITAKLVSDIPLPPGFERIPTENGTFSAYLRNIGLKDSKTVYLFNGKPKQNQEAQYALLNISVGNRDLQQCADAVMRLRAEYFFSLNQFDKIIFYDNDKSAYQFTSPYTRSNFDKYLERVFGMCGSASLSKQLKAVNDFNDIQPGDVLIRGGFPGHAVMVMDMAINAAGEKLYMIAQSYMPAQDIHVLKNPAKEDLSPWYYVNSDHVIQTPEYTFTKDELKRW